MTVQEREEAVAKARDRKARIEQEITATLDEMTRVALGLTTTRGQERQALAERGRTLRIRVEALTAERPDLELQLAIREDELRIALDNERERQLRQQRERLVMIDREGVRDIGARAAERAGERRELVDRLRELQRGSPGVPSSPSDVSEAEGLRPRFP